MFFKLNQWDGFFYHNILFISVTKAPQKNPLFYHRLFLGKNVISVGY